MKYTVYYKTDSGKRFFAKVEASGEREAENKVREKYNDIESVLFTKEGWPL